MCLSQIVLWTLFNTFPSYIFSASVFLHPSPVIRTFSCEMNNDYDDETSDDGNAMNEASVFKYEPC